MPPVAPHECVRENIQSAAFDYVWTAVSVSRGIGATLLQVNFFIFRLVGDPPCYKSIFQEMLL